MKVLVLGAGKMLGAILQGLSGSEDLSNWEIYSPSGKSAKDLALKVGAKHILNLDDAAKPDWVFVGCKPQQLKDLKLLIGERFNESLFVSVLAALSEDYQRSVLGVTKLIRLMPNLPVKVKAGVMLLSSESASNELSRFEKLFSQIGKVAVVKENELEELTLLTGSGPAFFYEFALELSKQSTSLSPQVREELARKVLEGAGIMLSQDSLALTEHINNVTSKGGVTIAVLERWRAINWGRALKEGLARGWERASELRDLLRQS